MMKSAKPLRRLLVCGAAALLGTAGVANAETIDAANPQSLVAALQSAGYKAVLGKDSTGDPKISSGASGANFTILFYGCENHAACTSIQFVAGYTVKTKPTLDKINGWNTDHRFSSAYKDKDGDPNITWDVVLQGGMTSALFEQVVSRWADTMAAFQTYVDW